MINILIIDDDTTTRFLLYEVFKMNNFNVFPAENGVDGLKSMIGKHRGPNKGRPKGTLKPKTTIEELQKENLKLQVEIERLKKGYLTKGVGAKKEFISINNKNFKSLDN